MLVTVQRRHCTVHSLAVKDWNLGSWCQETPERLLLRQYVSDEGCTVKSARLNLLVWDSQKVQKRKMLFNDRSFGMDLAPQAKPTMVNHPRCRMKQFKFEKCKYHHRCANVCVYMGIYQPNQCEPHLLNIVSIAQFYQSSFPRSCF